VVATIAPITLTLSRRTTAALISATSRRRDIG
jgi:hypothetical protein